MRRRAPKAVPTAVAPEQLADLCKRYYRPLLRYVRRSHRFSTEDAQDLVQEVFMLACVRLESEENVWAWLLRTADFLAANAKRKAARRADLLARFSQ